MTQPLTYARHDDGVAVATLDDGKVNVMSADMLAAIDGALDRSLDDGDVLVIAGRPGVFSAGYDMAMFDRTEAEIVATVRAGGELVARLLAHPLPVVAACTGHAIAQGAFTLLAVDVRIAAAGDFRLGLNEVAIGLTVPWYGIEAARLRLTPAAFQHALLTGAFYPPQVAQAHGFVDEVVDPAAVLDRAHAEARRLAALDLAAHAATKQRLRSATVAAIRAGIDEEFAVA